MTPGETLLNFDFQDHLWIVISNEVDGQVAVVNLTTFHAGRSDSTCTISPGEHTFVRHESCVAYRFAQMTPVEPLRRLKADGQLRQHDPVDHDLLRRIQHGALASRFVARKIQAAVRATLDAD